MAKKEQRTRQTHIYLTDGEHAALQKIAKEQNRSVNGQIAHYIKRGLEQDAR